MRVLTRTVHAISLLAIAGCGVSFAPLPAGSIAGRRWSYDYSPSVIQSGNLQQLWWCGEGYNPANINQFSDTIQYDSIDLTTKAHSGPVPVMAETQGAWDSVYTCNPKVVRGAFANPLGSGQSFTYAMYYVGTASLTGEMNSIGVAFSNDGLSWKKYPHPVLTAEMPDGYGVTQPAVHNDDGGSAIRLFYEDDSFYVHHVEASSSDGVHFSMVGTLTAKGLDANSVTWGDMSFDPQSGDWYASFNTPVRSPSTTGFITERGQYGVNLFRIPDSSLLTGATPWEFLTTIDTNLTGYESNFLAGFIRDRNGDVLSGPAVPLATSISNPPPPWNASPTDAGLSGSTIHWKISSFAWTPNQPLVPLNRYFNQMTHEVTTGWIDPQGGFSLEATLGHLYQSPQQGATVAFYACKNQATDYFVSLDSACEGARILGLNGYAFARAVPGLNTVAVYRCSTGSDHFVSADPKCEGHGNQGQLGFVLP